MKMLLIDDQNHGKIVELGPDFEMNIVDYMCPCNGCGEPTLHEYMTGFLCDKCTHLSRNRIEEKGWNWDHPGVFRKNFGDRITVLAGTGEYRFDFYFAGEDYDLAYSPDFDIEVDAWHNDMPGLMERKCFSEEEMRELQMVYEYLYTDKKKDEVFRKGGWEIEGGSLMEPDGLYCHSIDEDRETEPLRITKEMIFGVDCGDMSNEQHAKFAELHTILMTWLQTVK